MLARFLSGENPLITKLLSSTFTLGVDKQYWFSIAELAPALQQEAIVQKNGTLHGAGWDSGKELSQEKAITEAVERYAYLYYQKQAVKAGFDIDPSTTGFAALPAMLGLEKLKEYSLLESIERFCLNKIFYEQSIQLQTYFMEQILNHANTSYYAQFRYQQKDFYFVLYLNDLTNGTFISGTACDTNLERAYQSAKLEAFNNMRKAERIQKGIEKRNPKNLLESRLLEYAQNTKLANAYRKKIQQCLLRSQQLRISKIIFAQQLPGPWNPEITVFRTILADNESIIAGGIEKMMI